MRGGTIHKATLVALRCLGGLYCINSENCKYYFIYILDESLELSIYIYWFPLIAAAFYLSDFIPKMNQIQFCYFPFYQDVNCFYHAYLYILA